ncbi:MAG TPA: acyloxyacyl hydrolase [Syntrophorhabdaceae bacterium]
MKKRTLTFYLIALLLFSQAAFCPDKGRAEEGVRDVADRYGMAITGGNSYTPQNDISFVLLSGFALFDHEKVWGHKAPDGLRFKVETSLGTTTRPDKKLMTSANMFALYYLKSLAFKTFRPYLEGGIGIIYTDFQVEGQGLRFNFNPQVGVGVEFAAGPETTCLASLRLHHISNGGLNHDNRGINSVTLTLGRFF